MKASWLYRVVSIFAARAAFRQLHSAIQFVGLAKTAREAPNPTVVKAGFYYLFNYDTTYNIAHAPFKEPEDTHGAFQIRPNGVTYVGDWLINLQSVVATTSIDTIVRARKNNPWLERYPLYVSMIGRDTVRLPWEQVPQS